MSSRKKREAEFQYYEIPHGERLLALPNQRVAWDYGNIQESDKRHFHNLLEIGCCISGSGRIFFSVSRDRLRTGNDYRDTPEYIT